MSAPTTRLTQTLPEFWARALGVAPRKRRRRVPRYVPDVPDLSARVRAYREGNPGVGLKASVEAVRREYAAKAAGGAK